MVNFARILFPPVAAASLMLSFLAIIVGTSNTFANEDPIISRPTLGPCEDTGCVGSPSDLSTCIGGTTENTDPLYCPNLNCTSCTFDFDFETGLTVCACVY